MCRACKFWDPIGSDREEGLCRVTPPIINPRSHSNRGEWPYTRGGDWCGQYLAKGE